MRRCLIISISDSMTNFHVILQYFNLCNYIYQSAYFVINVWNLRQVHIKNDTKVNRIVNFYLQKCDLLLVTTEMARKSKTTRSERARKKENLHVLQGIMPFNIYHSKINNGNTNANVKITMDDIKERIAYWRTVVICYVLESNHPRSIIKGYFHKI